MNYFLSFRITDGDVDKLINIDDIDCSLLLADDKTAKAVDLLMLSLFNHSNYEFCLGRDQYYMFLTVEAATRYIEWRGKQSVINDGIYLKLEDINRKSAFFNHIFKNEKECDEALPILSSKNLHIPTVKLLENCGQFNKLRKLNGPKVI